MEEWEGEWVPLEGSHPLGMGFGPKLSNRAVCLYQSKETYDCLWFSIIVYERKQIENKEIERERPIRDGSWAATALTRSIVPQQHPLLAPPGFQPACHFACIKGLSSACKWSLRLVLSLCSSPWNGICSIF